MAKALDFRFLDEGLGGQNKKRKRDSEEEPCGEEAMALDSEPGPSDAHTQPQSTGQGTRTEGGTAEGAGVGDSQGAGGAPAAKRQRAGEGAGAGAAVGRNVMNLGRVSGRKWKDPKTGRASSLVRGQRRVVTSEERERERAVTKAFKERKEELKEDIRKSKRAHRERIEEKKRRKEANALKGAVVQRITNPRTLKKMSKKQLKQLVKV